MKKISIPICLFFCFVCFIVLPANSEELKVTGIRLDFLHRTDGLPQPAVFLMTQQGKEVFLAIDLCAFYILDEIISGRNPDFAWLPYNVEGILDLLSGTGIHLKKVIFSTISSMPSKEGSVKINAFLVFFSDSNAEDIRMGIPPGDAIAIALKTGVPIVLDQKLVNTLLYSQG